MKYKLAVYVISALVLGLAVGFFVGGRCERSPWRRSPEAMAKMLERKLDLDDTQMLKVREITRRTHDEFTQLRDRMRPEMENVRQKARNEVAALLKPEQKERFEKLNQELEEKRRRWEEGREK